MIAFWRRRLSGSHHQIDLGVVQGRALGVKGGSGHSEVERDLLSTLVEK